MIQIDTATDSLSRTGEDPYRQPADVVANPEDYSDPVLDMTGLLRQMVVLLERLTNSTERQRTTPGFTEATIGTGFFPTTISFRPLYLIFTNTAAASVTITYGTSVQRVFQLAQASTNVIPWTLTVGRGTEVAIAASAGTVSGWFIGYPE